MGKHDAGNGKVDYEETKKIVASIVVLHLIAVIAFWLVNMNMEQNRKARISNRLDRQYLWLSYG